ncbi:MAG TPA: hypothetical protein VGJ44_28330 [Kribbellaceae bacterium]
MGDIGTHAQITQYVVGQLKRVVPGRIPDGDYTYLELGNFLTDVSQFRDPPSYHAARDAARADAMAAAGAAAATRTISDRINAWARDMFGVAGEDTKHGQLPEFLHQLMAAMTHTVFDSDGLAAAGAVAAAVGVRTPALIPEHVLAPADVDRVLDAHYTQYWPHEHLDFPPCEDQPRHRDLWRFKFDGGRGLIAYLDEQLRYVIEELFKLEDQWVRARLDRGPSTAQRQEFLVRLGHLLHAVEDFYFHSNFAELRQWQVLAKAYPKLLIAQRAEKGLRGTGLDETSVRLRRLMHRRLRYPVWDRQDVLSPTTSDDGSVVCFTGGFGQTDVRHTLGGAFEGIEAKIDLLPNPDAVKNSDLELIRLMLNAEARRDLVRIDAGSGNELRNRRQRHEQQLRDGLYPPAIANWHAQHYISARAAEVLTDAFARDLAVEQAAGLEALPGPGGALITLLARIQEERDRSAARATELDRDAASITSDVSSNGASAENVGTHSLLSKDTGHSDPFRADALALAKHASAVLATTLLRRCESRQLPTPKEGIDWDAMVRSVVRFPAYRKGGWEEEVLGLLRGAAGRFTQPNLDKIKDQPAFPLLGPKREPQRLRDRRSGLAQHDLEAFYIAFETIPR